MGQRRLAARSHVLPCSCRRQEWPPAPHLCPGESVLATIPQASTPHQLRSGP